MNTPNYPTYEEFDAFYADYGKSLAAWARIEMMMLNLFTRSTAIEPSIGRRIFYSARSYSGRSDMLAAAIEVCDKPDETKRCYRDLIKKARTYYGFRNSIVHGEPITIMTKGPLAGQTVIIQGKHNELDHGDPSIITQEHMRNAAANYGRLSYYIMLAAGWDGTSGGSSFPDKCRELVLQLPSLPQNAPTEPTVEVPKPPLSPSRA